MEMPRVIDLCEGMDCSILGDPNMSVQGLAYRSDQVKPGDMFFCIPGLKADGHDFAQDAVDRGAQVLVVERVMLGVDTSQVGILVVKDSRKAMAHISARFFNKPSQNLALVGVTGTNGKTTTSYLIEHIAREASEQTGLIGTVETRIGNQRLTSSHTTPESYDLQKLLSRMRDNRCEIVVMEVSSHALELERTWGTQFAVTVFTNLTQDHLDFHKTFEAYFASKSRLFSSDYPAKRVICVDDSYGQDLWQRCVKAGDSVVTVGLCEDAQIRPHRVRYEATQTQVELEILGVRHTFTYPLVGQFNVQNVCCAIGTGLQLGLTAQEIIAALEDAPQIPGRLERVEDPHNGRFIFVDYAHTPDALEKAIETIKSFEQGKLTVVFGCGGDRDKGKRSLMGKAACKADYSFVTSDNPRSEDPQAIIDDIVAGMADCQERFEIVSDRRLAIRQALLHAQPGDCVLIAGKGHEDYQIVGSEVRDFDDRVVAAEELRLMEGSC